MHPRIRIRRVEESQRTLLYSFRPEGEGEGLLLLDKVSGKIVEVRPVEHPRALRFFRRAGRRVRQHWLRGEFPAETYWGAPGPAALSSSKQPVAEEQKKQSV